jgi:hypothetical protein
MEVRSHVIVDPPSDGSPSVCLRYGVEKGVKAWRPQVQNSFRTRKSYRTTTKRVSKYLHLCLRLRRRGVMIVFFAGGGPTRFHSHAPRAVCRREGGRGGTFYIFDHCSRVAVYCTWIR